MIKKIAVFLAGITLGMLAMGGTVYYLRDHYAMNFLPWIMVAVALIFVLLCVIAYLSAHHQVVKLQKQNAAVTAAAAAAASSSAAAAPSSSSRPSADH